MRNLKVAIHWLAGRMFGVYVGKVTPGCLAPFFETLEARVQITLCFHTLMCSIAKQKSPRAESEIRKETV